MGEGQDANTSKRFVTEPMISPGAVISGFMRPSRVGPMLENFEIELEVAMVPWDEGAWMLHCHIAEHLEAGMKMVFRVSDESN